MSGHLHPILGIGRRLARDHHVRVISTAGALPEIAAAGLDGYALLSGADAVISAIVNPPHAVRSNPWRLHRQFSENLGLLQQFRRELLALWSDAPPELVIADFTVPVVADAARERGVRWWTSAPSPCAIETADGPPGYLGGWKPRPDLLGRGRDAVGRGAVRLFKRMVHRCHRDALGRLGFPAVYRADGSEAIYSSACVLALGLADLEFPRRYPSAVEFVGPVLYTPPADIAPPECVAGRAHVLVTAGTHLRWRKDALLAAVQRAARALPHVEFHVSDGDRASDRREASGNVHRLGFVSYERDLARYALVVHHGGTGVLYRTLGAGIPAVVLPADFDQFDNAARLEVAEVGLWVRHLENLPDAIATCLADVAMRERCRALQALPDMTGAEDRVARLVAQSLGPK